MQNLQSLIDMLTKGRKLHICIMDVSGILSAPATKASGENRMHVKEFCNIAKSTDKGYALCMECKGRANTKAVTGKKPFCGHCRYGLYEAAHPVVIGETVAAVVYVGNAVIALAQTKARINSSCRQSGVDRQKLYEQLSECEQLDGGEDLLAIAEIVADYIKLLYKKEEKPKQQLHWLALAMKQYADQNYLMNPMLKQLAVLYQKNEKYMGRLFQKEMGMSFRKYCLLLRLQKAAALLEDPALKAIDVAIECGFDNISYFNRSFKAQYGVTPMEYARKKQKKDTA